MTRAANQLIRIGRITAPHGVRGEVRVQPLTDFPERFTTLRRVLLGTEARSVGVRYRGTVRGMVILALEGVTDRNEAEKLRGQLLLVPRSEVHPLPPGQYYVFDLIGLEVVDPRGNWLGTLADVDRSATVHDLFVVETASGKRCLVPAVQAFIREVNLAEGRVVIQPIPGLLED
ncbi:MAG TPA: ribosome maturation factor RimM [Symbiobacteriaceae bacterium]